MLSRSKACLFVPFLSLLTSQFTFTQASGGQSPSIHEYKYPLDGFSISATSTPDIHNDAQAPDVKIYSWRFDGDVRFAIHVGVRPNCQETLAKLKQALSKERSMQVTANGLSGVESESVNSSYKTVERLYCGTEKAYTLTGRWRAEESEPNAVRTLFKSFALLGNKH